MANIPSRVVPPQIVRAHADELANIQLQVVARQFANMANIPSRVVPPQRVRAHVDELANIQL